MANIEAHITGNVWKITCAVGDTIEDGDEVVSQGKNVCELSEFTFTN